MNNTQALDSEYYTQDQEYTEDVGNEINGSQERRRMKITVYIQKEGTLVVIVCSKSNLRFKLINLPSHSYSKRYMPEMLLRIFFFF